VLTREWDRHEINVPLVIVDSPYRELSRPVIGYIRGAAGTGPPRRRHVDDSRICRRRLVGAAPGGSWTCSPNEDPLYLQSTGFVLDPNGDLLGVLCHSCNLGLGYFKDDPARLEAAMRYLATCANAQQAARRLPDTEHRGRRSQGVERQEILWLDQHEQAAPSPSLAATELVLSSHSVSYRDY
jgi:Recombination endonuclease VII